jgi:hypothetical protein
MNIGKKKIFSSFLILGIVGILLLINGRVTHGAVSNVGFTVSPATPNYMMDFGEVETCVRGENFPVIKDFHITNTSGGDKTITVSTSVSGTGFSCISNCQSFTLASTESSKAITIKFSPSFSKINRAFTGSVTFTAIGGEPISVNLKGNGVCYSNYPIAQPGAPELPDKDCDSRSGPTNTCDPNVSNSGECCYVGSNISDSAGCVPTCDFTNATIKPEPWSKYKLKCVPGEYCGEEIGTKHRCWVVDSKMCSTADKLAFDGKTPTPNPHLRWGDCACGSVGQQYKVCCAISPSVTNATSVTPTNAVKSSFQDPYDPLEGVCGGSTTVVALPDPTSNFGDKYPASCPQVPVFDVFEAKTVTGTQTAVVTWKIKDGTADWCGDANFATNDEIKAAGLTQGTLTKPIPASGSFTIGCKDKYHYVVGNSVLTQAIYKSASATPGGAAFYYCPAPSGTCIPVGGSYASIDKCSTDVGSTCYKTADECATSSACRVVPPQGSRYMYYCKTAGGCQKTSNKYQTVADCQSNLTRYLPGQTTGVCYETEAACNLACTFCPASCATGKCPHKACQNQSCASVNACGTDKCATNDECKDVVNKCPSSCLSGKCPYKACQNQSCASVNACGTDKCATNDQCKGVVNNSGSINGGGCAKWPPECGGLTSSKDVTSGIGISPSYSACLPKQPEGSKDTKFSWSANSSASCAAIIDGGSANSSDIVCRNSTNNWNACESGSGSISGSKDILNLQQTTTYGLECVRKPYTCTFTYPWDFDEKTGETGCDKWCADCGTNCDSCNCPSHCQDYYDDDAHCSNWKQCPSTCIRSCTNPNGTPRANPDGTPCTESYSCTVNCPSPDEECLEYDCRDYNYIGTRTSKEICPDGTDKNSVTVRVVQKPKDRDVSLQAKPEGAGDDKFSPGLAKILLTKFAEFKLGVKVDLSGFATKMYCELRRKEIDSGGSFLKITGLPTLIDSGSGAINAPPPAMKDNALYGSDYRTSQYQLYCRNQSWYNNGNEAGSCYDEAETSGNLKVEPYGTKLEPKAGWLERIRDIFLTTRVNKGLAGGE